MQTARRFENDDLPARVTLLEDEIFGRENELGIKRKVESIWRYHLWIPIALSSLLGVAIGALIVTVALVGCASQSLRRLPSERQFLSPPHGSQVHPAIPNQQSKSISPQKQSP